MTDATVVNYEWADGVAYLTINRPERRNAINENLLNALYGHLQAIQAEGRTRVIVLTGVDEKAFCAGADLQADSTIFKEDHSEPHTLYARLLREAIRCNIPIVARVNGDCLAGGMGLLAMCDMAVAVDTARFGLPEVKVGMFAVQVAALLQSAVPRTKFNEMCYTGGFLTAAEAAQYNLVNYVVPRAELDEKVTKLVDDIKKNSPTAIRLGKHTLRAMRFMDVEQALSFAEVQLGKFSRTEDAHEGLSAFQEKRSPVWTGR